MHIREIEKITSGRLLAEGNHTEIKTLNVDSRKSAANTTELFVALKGTHHNGHDFIRQLHALGVRNFLVAQDIPPLAESNILKVDDCLRALQQIAAVHRRLFAFPVIGITGSNGKTIVKEWLSTLLQRQWNVVKSPKSFNSQVGVPLSVWLMDQASELAVFEAGISTTGEMEHLAQIIKPTHGIFTNIGSAHDEGFSSQKQKVTEKARLFKDSQMVICRYDHRLICETLQETSSARLVAWSIENTAADLNFRKAAGGFRVNHEGKEFFFQIHLTNGHDLENVLHIITLALSLEEQHELIQAAINTLRPVPMRLELKRGTNDTFILDDSYNNDLQGLKIALEYLLQQPKKRKKTVILSDILQSGKPSRQLYEEVNALLEKHQVDRLIGIGTELAKSTHVFTLPFQSFSSGQDLMRSAPDFSDEIILVKGARQFGLEKVVAYLEEKSHGTVLEVNFEALTHNLNVYRSRLRTDVRLMVMVKAFAYGLGVEEIAHLLQYHKVDYLGVAYLDEAIHLRKKGIDLPIMIMNPEWESFSLLKTFDVEPEIYSLEMMKQFIETCPDPPSIHLKIETGMHRLGFEEAELSGLATMLRANPQIKVAGIFTHFSSSDSRTEDDYTRQQAQKFEYAYEYLANALGYRPLRHALNSSGILRWPAYQFDMVRLGIGLYGYDSTGEMTNLRPISTLKTRISQVKPVQKGDSIGYSRKGMARQDGEIATLAIGYADGYSRAFGNGKAHVMINGKQAKTIGNVCMDMTMVDVTGLNAKEGDEVIVFGRQPTIVELAEWAGTIPYEILTNVSQRVKRVFISE